MKILYILFGIPGSGKSTFLKQNNLIEFAISPDAIRLELATPELGVDGNLTIIQDPKAWDIMYERVEERMRKGSLIFADATHTNESYFNKYLNIAYKYSYKVVAIDFRDVSLYECIKRNHDRLVFAEYKYVPESVLHRMHDQIQSLKIPKKIKIIKPENFKLKTIEDYKIDLSNYQKIIHIGDIQGMGYELEKYFEKYPFSPENYYIFVGDLVDRGDSNHIAVQKFIELSEYKNVTFIEGNHDTHLKKWAFNQEVTSNEFNKRTKPQLEKNNINMKQVKVAVSKLKPFSYYTYDNKKVFVCHGGLSNLPSEIEKVSNNTFIRGVGKYEDSEVVDDSFVKLTGSNTYQIHGHRNQHNVTTSNTKRTFNLEGKIEFGGNIRVVELSKNGFEIVEFSSQESVFNKISDPEPGVIEIVEQFEKSDHIKKSQLPNKLCSYNFTRNAFSKSIWNETTMKARGFFINTQTKQIVIRGYDKFFNDGEMKHQKSFKFPICVYHKENGYLGLLGYDITINSLVFATKATTQSEYVDWFKELFYKTFDDKKIELIKQYLKEHSTTMVYEVIQPMQDPHIIEEKKPRLVLLDIIKNKVNFEKQNYNFLEDFVTSLDNQVDIKRQNYVFESEVEYTNWKNKIVIDYTLNIEGYVIEDSSGFMLKIKLPYYNFWKYMRTVLDLYNNEKTISKSKLGSIKAEKFIKFLEEQKASGVTFSNIIAARKNFELND
jgi:predicted kinase/UDP-2,3-diacylglucosamine pyrophosphatase LpxH